MNETQLEARVRNLEKEMYKDKRSLFVTTLLIVLVSFSALLTAFNLSTAEDNIDKLKERIELLENK